MASSSVLSSVLKNTGLTNNDIQAAPSGRGLRSKQPSAAVDLASHADAGDAAASGRSVKRPRLGVSQEGAVDTGAKFGDEPAVVPKPPARRGRPPKAAVAARAAAAAAAAADAEGDGSSAGGGSRPISESPENTREQERAARRRNLNRHNARLSRMRRKAYLSDVSVRIASLERREAQLKDYLASKLGVDPEEVLQVLESKPLGDEAPGAGAAPAGKGRGRSAAAALGRGGKSAPAPVPAPRFTQGRTPGFKAAAAEPRGPLPSTHSPLPSLDDEDSRSSVPSSLVDDSPSNHLDDSPSNDLDYGVYRHHQRRHPSHSSPHMQGGSRSSNSTVSGRSSGADFEFVDPPPRLRGGGDGNVATAAAAGRGGAGRADPSASRGVEAAATSTSSSSAPKDGAGNRLGAATILHQLHADDPTSYFAYSGKSGRGAGHEASRYAPASAAGIKAGAAAGSGGGSRGRRDDGSFVHTGSSEGSGASRRRPPGTSAVATELSSGASSFLPPLRAPTVALSDSGISGHMATGSTPGFSSLQDSSAGASSSSGSEAGPGGISAGVSDPDASRSTGSLEAYSASASVSPATTGEGSTPFSGRSGGSRSSTNATKAGAVAAGPDPVALRALAAASMCFIQTDAKLPDNPIIYASDGFLALTGYTREEVIGRNCRFLQGPQTDRAAITAMSARLAAGSSVSVTLLNYRKDGRPFWNHVHIEPLRDAAGEVTAFIGVQAKVDGPDNTTSASGSGTSGAPTALAPLRGRRSPQSAGAGGSGSSEAAALAAGAAACAAAALTVESASAPSTSRGGSSRRLRGTAPAGRGTPPSAATGSEAGTDQ